MIKRATEFARVLTGARLTRAYLTINQAERHPKQHAPVRHRYVRRGR